MGMKNWIKAVVFLMLGCAMQACINDDEEDQGTVNLQAGDHVPAFSVLMNDGQTVTDGSLKGKPSLIVFFYTKCSDCQKELPVLQRIYADYGKEINMVCISREEGAVDVAAYWAENHFTLPYSAQQDRTIYHLFAKSGVPRVYVVDRDLVIRTVFTDNPLASYEDLSDAIEAHLSF